MAKEKPFDYKQASEIELDQRLGKSQEQLFKLRFRAVSAPVKNTMEIRHIRREIARINTFINQRKQRP
jgi:large subunit ribosomal protein L29